MKEYTVLASISVLVTCLADAQSGVRLLKRPLYYLFLLVIACFKLAVNGYLTSSGIVLYNPEFFSQIRVTSIPLEDFLFGFSMVTMTIIFWERLKRHA